MFEAGAGPGIDPLLARGIQPLAPGSALDAIAPLAQAAIKGSLRSTFGLPLEQSFSIDNEFRRPLESTADYAEGIEALAQKRKPVFKGK